MSEAPLLPKNCLAVSCTRVLASASKQSALLQVVEVVVEHGWPELHPGAGFRRYVSPSKADTSKFHDYTFYWHTTLRPSFVA
jgi:hypothetical protein